MKKKINANDINLQRFVCFTFLPLLNDGEVGIYVYITTHKQRKGKRNHTIKTHLFLSSGCGLCPVGGFEF